jgi:hypothetical protein
MMKNVAVVMGVQTSLRYTDFIFFVYIYPEVGLLDHIVVIFIPSFSGATSTGARCKW